MPNASDARHSAMTDGRNDHFDVWLFFKLITK
jgi:hypothetical protein